MVCLIIIAGGIFLLNKFITQFDATRLLNVPFVREQIQKAGDNEGNTLLQVVPRLLGFDTPRTYLILFLNNTELRPGGGFIGVYATVRVDKGQASIRALEGSEALDRRSPPDFREEPPYPMRERLKIDRWQFRDANWSPDFAESAKKALEFYEKEGGVAADGIDAVIAITPTVLEELMKITGPFTIDGVTFTPDKVTEQLEYEVEFGYDERGVPFHERKQIIRPFFIALLSHMKSNLFSELNNYISLFERLAKEKHILMYAIDPVLADEVETRAWTGRMATTTGDYLMWVDANLSALKTDYALTRHLFYSLAPYDHRYIATTTMEYEHRGGFDWRTSRYRTYTRVYVPSGAQFISAQLNTSKGVQDVKLEEIRQGEENERHWFGFYFAIEPGTTGSLQFVYTLPDQLTRNINGGLYTLFVQKQLGTVSHGLTVDLDFGTTIEARQRHYETDLKEDREFYVD